jgi:sialate O-acetylesterase
LLYNAMISPLIPFAIKGAIWYQGENNAGRAYQYRKAFPLMITDWRKHWGQGNFPFYFVQLASFGASNGTSEKGSTWAELREAQALTLSLPNTGMAVTTDIGETKDIHPKNKQDVGKRLAAVALHNTYGRANMVYSGPEFKSMQVDGNKAILSFKNIGKGLCAGRQIETMDPSVLKKIMASGEKWHGASPFSIEGFEIAGEDRKFYHAAANIDGDKVVLSSVNVIVPVSIRYAWADDAGTANLFNRDGFPAAPFRTDQWKGITENAKYRGK